ncbi:V-type ATPase assembly factor PKR1 [Aspergillus brunneoviolaceus CBS 621.78]|uniref:Pkr1-domain-containing protein n=1 Tax=Aspergillus brunneoviolaceus CBS 621.78 TaxID=1450534 RepID=A0ACD1FZK8_9EURO|nr:Pkr1-domain-containing protein [Aspergillus brunneoviolaceus CBS 621.78]RAH42419.1 Pkr1-domain-containing protein [Aspergillus brunneoviolaceus CBS 621.78]
MASFMEDLWSSIFTPGPTPTLLVATNVTFAALQALLLSLLLATYSIHFLVLSFLSGALWWSINWFAREVRQFQAEQAEKQKQADEEQDESSEDKPDSSIHKSPGAVDATDSDTETEQIAGRKETAPAPTSAPRSTTASATLQLPEAQGEIRKRLSVSGESSGYQSTDSEWEKVDDNQAA